ncbi:MAG: ABC transporter permease [Lautropia sp.]
MLSETGASAATSRLGRAAGHAAFFVLLLVVWDLLHRHLGPDTVAAPSDIAERLVRLTGSGDIFRHILATGRVAVAGLVLGWVGGLLVAVLLARLPRLAAAVEPYILGSMGIPKFALAPLLILWFGIGDAPKVVVTTLMVFYVMFITTLSGIRSIDRGLLAMARLVGANRYWVNREIVLNTVIPYMLAGLKIGLPRAIGAAVVGEFLVADHGLGFYIEYSRQTADITGVYAGLVVVLLLVLGSDFLLGRASKRLLAWVPKKVAL